MNPLVSIIIPVYNSEKHLAECIESAITQTLDDKEIILVDDGSTDSSYNIAQKYADQPNVKLIRQENKGASAARNTGLKEAKGYYIQFLDADDLLSPDKIEAQIKTLNGSQTHLSICKTVHFNDGENHVDGSESNNWFYADNNNPVDFLTKLYAGDDVLSGYGGMVAIHSWLSPKSLIEKAGPWNEKLSLDDDGEFFCRVVLASDGIMFSDKGFNYYRKFNDRQSLSAQKSKKAMESAVLAIDLKLEHMRAQSQDPIIDRVFAKHYWWTGVLAYPQFKSLSAYCIQKAKQLGYTGEKYVGGRSGHALAAFAGWKFARLVAYYRQLFKKNNPMKKASLIFLFVTCAAITRGQPGSSDQQAVQMLKEFYIKYNTAWSTIKDSGALIKELVALQKRYCTLALRKELRDLFKQEGLDHDLLLNDEGTDVAHLNTLKIIKDPAKANAYIVSYIDHTMSPSYKPIDKTVVVHVTVKKEEGSFKIADAYGDAIR